MGVGFRWSKAAGSCSRSVSCTLTCSWAFRSQAQPAASLEKTPDVKHTEYGHQLLKTNCLAFHTCTYSADDVDISWMSIQRSFFHWFFTEFSLPWETSICCNIWNLSVSHQRRVRLQALAFQQCGADLLLTTLVLYPSTLIDFYGDSLYSIQSEIQTEMYLAWWNVMLMTIFCILQMLWYWPKYKWVTFLIQIAALSWLFILMEITRLLLWKQDIVII